MYLLYTRFIIVSIISSFLLTHIDRMYIREHNSRFDIVILFKMTIMCFCVSFLFRRNVYRSNCLTIYKNSIFYFQILDTMLIRLFYSNYTIIKLYLSKLHGHNNIPFIIFVESNLSIFDIFESITRRVFVIASVFSDDLLKLSRDVIRICSI